MFFDKNNLHVKNDFTANDEKKNKKRGESAA